MFIPVFEHYRRKKTKANPEAVPFLSDGFQWWFLKKEIPAGNEGSGYPPLSFEFTYVMFDSSFPRCLLEVFKIKQGLGC